MEKKIKIGLIITILVISIIFISGCVKNKTESSINDKRGIFLADQIDELNESQTLNILIFTSEEPTSEQLNQIKSYGDVLAKPKKYTAINQSKVNKILQKHGVNSIDDLSDISNFDEKELYEIAIYYWITFIKTDIEKMQEIEYLDFVYEVEISQIFVKRPWMNKVGSLVMDKAIERPFEAALNVYIYCKDKPISKQVDQIELLSGYVDLEHWIPPVGSHPNGFFPATIKVKSLPRIAKMEWVSQILSAERVHTFE